MRHEHDRQRLQSVSRLLCVRRKKGKKQSVRKITRKAATTRPSTAGKEAKRGFGGVQMGGGEERDTYRVFGEDGQAPLREKLTVLIDEDGIESGDIRAFLGGVNTRG